MSTRMQAVAHVTRAELALARSLTVVGDRVRARALASEARERARRLGMHALLSRAQPTGSESV